MRADSSSCTFCRLLSRDWAQEWMGGGSARQVGRGPPKKGARRRRPETPTCGNKGQALGGGAAAQRGAPPGGRASPGSSPRSSPSRTGPTSRPARGAARPRRRSGASGGGKKAAAGGTDRQRERGNHSEAAGPAGCGESAWQRARMKREREAPGCTSNVPAARAARSLSTQASAELMPLEPRASAALACVSGERGGKGRGEGLFRQTSPAAAWEAEARTRNRPDQKEVHNLQQRS